jgi:hypothetical protein
MDRPSSPVLENGTVKIPQKRPRPVLSCFDCRRKKLKCSRMLPCAQCSKTGRASQCSYNEYPPGAPSSEGAQDVSHSENGGEPRKTVRRKITEHHEDTESPSHGSITTQTSVVRLGIMEDLQNRVERLENQLKTHNPSQDNLRDNRRNEDYRAKRYDTSFRGVVRLKDFTTRYHGQNQKVALVNHVGLRWMFVNRVLTTIV